jgi:hypothetical protein
MTAGLLSPVGQGGGVVGIVGEDERVRQQIRLDSCQLLGLVVVGVQAVVQKQADVPQFLQLIDGASMDRRAGTRLPDRCRSW